MTDFTARMSLSQISSPSDSWNQSGDETIKKQGPVAARSLRIRHLLPQRHCHHDEEAQGQRGLEHGGC